MLVETDRSVRAGVPESTRRWWAAQGLQRSALSPRAMSPSAPRGDTPMSAQRDAVGKGTPVFSVTLAVPPRPSLVALQPSPSPDRQRQNYKRIF